MINNDTISAIATGLTDSGIGIIRISGKDALKIGDLLFRSPSGKKIVLNAKTHTLNYGFIIDIEKENNSFDWKESIIDEVLVSIMIGPKSFTGEDTVEIQCHGGVFVMQTILKATLKAGARLAEPGEFTKRAFLNGRLDLSKAEAVMDIIHSQNEYSLISSVNQLRGNLSEKVKELRSKIIYEIAFIESALDDPEHISLEGYTDRLNKIIDELIYEIDKLLSRADDGKMMKEGINTVIVGKPNAGKSSLLNLLVGEERAIVTDIAGTTRDILRESVRFHGINFNIIDTAGIHNTEDIVEKIGIEKAENYAKDSDLVLFVIDSSIPLDDSDRRIVTMLEKKKVIILLNKCDLNSVVMENEIQNLFQTFLPEKRDYKIIKTSAKNSEGLDEFEKVVKEMFFHGEIKANNEILISNIRHKEALQDSLNSLKLVKRSIEDDMPEDFYSIDLMSAYSSLGRIIGEEVDDDLVDEIFHKFCLGK